MSTWLKQEEMTPELWNILSALKISIWNYFNGAKDLSADDQIWIRTTLPMQILSDLVHDGAIKK